MIRFTKTGLQGVADDVRRLAEKEGLTGHAASVEVRLRNGKETPASAAGKPGRADLY